MRPPHLEILFDDGHYVASSKPSGLATIPGRGEETSAFEQLAELIGLPHKGESDPRLRVVHRIDKDTSGLVVFARHKDAQRHLSQQFQNNLVEKQYLALVAGTPPEERGEIDAPIAVHPATKKRMTVSRHGRPARTLWQIESRFRGLTLLRVFPKTGKTHQIRVHLQSIGLPLAIDPLYNPPRRRDDAAGLFLSAFKRDYRPVRDEAERPLIDRLTLHAESLGFTHFNGSPVNLTAPLPKDFRAVINMLSKYARA
jgi:23S rRNA pseudouridine955/2504/2580 synthase/23S rRNA pseudouridine1911/1915/1917 synthase